eukprot:gene3190-3764_t
MQECAELTESAPCMAKGGCYWLTSSKSCTGCVRHDGTGMCDAAPGCAWHDEPGTGRDYGGYG